tara:strand:- start:872 stop:2233 length:1362 start_codon:yes stop_codon:yes gene_type:complete
MAKTKISELDAAAANNTDINSVDVSEGCAPSGINNAIREMGAMLKRMDNGTDHLTNPNITGDLDIIGDLDVDNININGNTISSTDTNGNITLAPNGTGDVVMGGDVKIGDSDALSFGDGLDLQIVHNGSNSFITDAGTGDMYIRGDSSLFIQKLDGTENKAQFITDGAVNLMHDGTTRFSTSSTGVDITGTSKSDLVVVDSSGGGTPTYSHTNNGEGITLRYNDDSGARAADIVATGNTPAGATMAMRFFVNPNSTDAASEVMRLQNGAATFSGAVTVSSGEIKSTSGAVVQESNSIRTAMGNDGGSSSFGTTTNHALNIASNNTTRFQVTNDGVLGNFNGRNSAGIISSKTSITVGDDSSVTIVDASASQIAGRGMLLIYETSGGSGGTFTAGFGSATLLNTTNNFGTGADFVVGDIDNNFCVIVSGHEITFKNRIGSSRAFHIQFIGAGIT